MIVDVRDREAELTLPASTPYRPEPVTMEMRLRLAKMLDEQLGITDDPAVPTEELVRQIREATQPLAVDDPLWASRDLIAMRDEQAWHKSTGTQARCSSGILQR